jgi:4-amino-4-deoxy-L-arabinose transferase-like glycosyltransferase
MRAPAFLRPDSSARPDALPGLARPFLLWFAAALVLRAGVAVVLGPMLERAEAAGFAEDGSAYYLPLAQSLWEGRGFANADGVRTASHMPGYPLLLVAARAVTPSFGAAIRTVQVVFGSFVVALVFLLTASLLSRRAAHLSAFAALVWPDLILYSLLNLSDTPFMALTLAGAWLLSRQTIRGTGPLAAGLGVTCGLGALVRESMIAFAAAWLLAVLLLPRDAPRPRRTLQGVLMVAAMVLALLPWWVRNATTLGAFIPLTTKGGRNVYAGTLVRPYYFSDARNNALPLPSEERRREDDVEQRAREAPTAREGDRIFLAAAFENLRRDPLGQLAHLGRKLFWLWQPNIAPRHAERLGMAPVFWAIAVAHGLLLVVGGAGLWMMRSDRRALLTLSIPFLWVTLFHAVVGIGEPRYHLALLPILMVALQPPLGRLFRLRPST